MRRSQAPSQKVISVSRTEPISTKPKLGLVDVAAPCSSEIPRKFIVVYGNVSGRKHKIYDSDGTLEILGSTMNLKDANGKVVHMSC